MYKLKWKKNHIHSMSEGNKNADEYDIIIQLYVIKRIMIVISHGQTYKHFNKK